MLLWKKKTEFSRQKEKDWLLLLQSIPIPLRIIVFNCRICLLNARFWFSCEEKHRQVVYKLS
jgi:hypothetical protein